MPRSARLEKGDCGLLSAGAPSASARPSLPSWDAQGRAESLARTPAAAATPQSLRRPHSPDAATAAAGGAVSSPLVGADCPQAPRAEHRGRRVQAVGAAAAGAASCRGSSQGLAVPLEAPWARLRSQFSPDGSAPVPPGAPRARPLAERNRAGAHLRRTPGVLKRSAALTCGRCAEFEKKGKIINGYSELCPGPCHSSIPPCQGSHMRIMPLC